MKKLIILTVLAAFFAACNNSPEVSESATKVADLGKWVDSIKNLVSSSSTFDSATWAGYSEGFNTANESINDEELDEVTRTTHGTIQSTWEGIGESYRSGIENSKKAALEEPLYTPDNLEVSQEDFNAVFKPEDDSKPANEKPLKSNK